MRIKLGRLWIAEQFEIWGDYRVIVFQFMIVEGSVNIFVIFYLFYFLWYRKIDFKVAILICFSGEVK